MKPKLVLTGRIFHDKGRFRDGIHPNEDYPQKAWLVIEDKRYEYRVQYQTPKQGDPMLQYLDAELWERWDKKYQTEPSK